QLTGGGCRCAGMLEVNWENKWSRVCRGSVSKAGMDGVCRQLGCGPLVAKPLQLVLTGGNERRTRPLRFGCGGLGDFLLHNGEKCRLGLQREDFSPPSPSPAPDRLRLVDGEFFCSGFVELHKQGLWGAVASDPLIRPELATRICQSLQCGTAIDRGEPKRESHLPVRWEAAEPCESRRISSCFNRTSARRWEAPAFIACSGPQPQALRRLAAGPTPCEGDVEVFHEGRWRALCDNWLQRAKWGRQLCQELRCGNLSSSAEIRDPASTGVPCSLPTLHLCHASLGAPKTCSRTRVVCQDSKPRPAGTAAGTIASICLALLLFGILLLLCGPPAYRRLMKR
ncbi:CD5 protein, partial [Lophotis ruficrista]|nr:CD5 protein [Lophotis ruficrista]